MGMAANKNYSNNNLNTVKTLYSLINYGLNEKRSNYLKRLHPQFHPLMNFSQKDQNFVDNNFGAVRAPQPPRPAQYANKHVPYARR